MTDVLGWDTACLDELSDFIQYGYTASASPRGQVRMVRITDIQGGDVDWEDVPFCNIEHSDESKYLLQAGDILIARTGATVGKSYIVPRGVPKSVFASYLIRLRPSTHVDAMYIKYFMDSGLYWKQVRANQVGIGQPNVNGSKLSRFTAPLPPLAEQKRIVARIEELLSEIDNGIANLKRGKALMVTYRQSVVQSAISGKLGGRNLDCEKWREMRLGDVTAELRTGPFGSSLHKHDYVDSGIPVINPAHIFNGRIVPSSSVTVSLATRDRLAAYVLKENDIIMGRRGEMGRCAIVTKHETGWLCGTGSLILRLRENADPRFVQRVISSPLVRDFLREASVGSTMDNLNQKAFKSLPLNLPPLDQQKQIVDTIELSFDAIDTLAVTLEHELSRVAQLRNSILHQAFTGQLVPQDPNDEPASVLLERIKAEKNKSAATKPTTRRTRKTA